MFIVLLGLLGLCVTSSLGVEVELQGLGRIRGSEEVARDGVKFYSFKGVPYLDPPVGMFRFRPGNAVAPWEGVKDATKFGSKCVQNNYGDPGRLEGDEDCLYLNVYTKNPGSSVKRPVLFFIHGGAFIFGSSDIYGGEYIMEQDVVLVTINYRLGPFGFLSTEDKAGPGNYGLHDQQAGLRWVQDHIHLFGGDKDLVTLMGLSAGGASVHYHVLSPNSAGLFHRAISFSGSALCWWANLPNPAATATKLGAAVSCPTDSSAQLLECLRGKPAAELMVAQRSLYAWHHDKVEAEPMNIWSPRADLEAGNTAILPVSPHLAMEVGQIQPVPFLVGVAESEGIWRAVNYLTQDAVMSEALKDFDTVAPWALGLHGQVKTTDLNKIVKKIKKYYLSALKKEKDMEKRLNKVVSGFVQMLGDSMFNYPIDRMVKLHGNKEYAPVWMYEFNYKHNHSLALFDLANPGEVKKPEENLEYLNRPTHAHELSMLFPAFEDKMGPLSKEETKYSKKFVKFITDFAVKGVPTQDGKYEMGEWKPVADGQLTYLVFGRYTGTQMGLPFQQRMKWWNQLPVYWKKEKEDKKQDGGDVENGGNSADENGGSPDEENAATSAEEVEELTDAEVEDLEVNRILTEMKDEL